MLLGTTHSLADFLLARHFGYYQHHDGFDEHRRDVDTVAAVTRAPRSVLAEFLEWPSDWPDATERATFLLEYLKPRSLEDVWATARAYGRVLTGARDTRGAIANVLLAWELERFPEPTLTTLLQFMLRGDVRLKSYAKSLGLL